MKAEGEEKNKDNGWKEKMRGWRSGIKDDKEEMEEEMRIEEGKDKREGENEKINCEEGSKVKDETRRGKEEWAE